MHTTTALEFKISSQRKVLFYDKIHPPIIMARRKISIDDRIEQQKLVVSKAKDRYEAELEQLNQLMKKQDEIRNKELLQAIKHSSRSFEEIMDFLGTDDFQD